MNWTLILQLVNVIPKIQEAIRQGGSVLTIIQNLAPDLLPILQQIGLQLFPQVDPSKSAQAAIDSMFDTDGIMWVQNNLNTLGQSPPLTVDGKNGPMTMAAVKAFQINHNLKVDGWSGPKTSAAIALDVAKLT